LDPGEPNDVITPALNTRWESTVLHLCSEFRRQRNCRGICRGSETGLAKMFTMMNESRLETALEALPFRHVLMRTPWITQNKSTGRPFLAGKDGKRVRIIEHEDIRRMLMNMKSVTEGMRALMFKDLFPTGCRSYGNDEK